MLPDKYPVFTFKKSNSTNPLGFRWLLQREYLYVNNSRTYWHVSFYDNVGESEREYEINAISRRSLYRSLDVAKQHLIIDYLKYYCPTILKELENEGFVPLPFEHDEIGKAIS